MKEKPEFDVQITSKDGVVKVSAPDALHVMRLTAVVLAGACLQEGMSEERILAYMLKAIEKARGTARRVNGVAQELSVD